MWTVCCLAFVALLAAPAVDAMYSVNMTFSIPAYNIYEPIQAWVDLENEMQRLEYYDGLDVTILKNKFSYTIVPQYDEQVCSMFPMLWLGASIVDLIPNTASMAYNGTETITTSDGTATLCDVYVSEVMNGSLLSTYTFYSAVATGDPVQYHMHGYNIMFGSHYDDYLVTYQGYSNASFSKTVFDLPQDLKCPFLGDSEEQDEQAMKSPTNDLGRLFPEHEAAIADDVDVFYNQFRAHHELGEEVDMDVQMHEKQLFKANLHLVNSINRKQKSYTASLLDKPFATKHLTDIRRTHLGLTGGRQVARQTLNGTSNGAYKIHTQQLRLEDASPFNWVDKGAVTPIKDQGSCGSCWSFGSHESIEGAHFLQTGTLVPLSAQWLMDCGWKEGNHGCDGGLDSFAYNTIMRLGGIPTEANVPYLMNSANCNATVEKAVELQGFVNVTSGDEAALLDALTNQGPISVAIDVSDDMVFYKSGVFSDVENCLSGHNDLDHAVLLVGWGLDENKQAYWILKNSWSTLWGEDGYIRVSQAQNQCGIATEPTYVVLK